MNLIVQVHVIVQVESSRVNRFVIRFPIHFY